jgi:hypothetical protein
MQVSRSAYYQSLEPPPASVNNQEVEESQIASRLGITDPAFLKGDLIRVDVNLSTMKNLNLRMPTGQESGANGQFVLGGKTSGGVTEGVVNGIPKKAPGVTQTTIPNL